MSRAVKPHREILKDLIKARGLTLEKVADHMGFKSPRAVAHKLAGTRDWATGEPERMAKLVGITLVQLAEMSSDMHLTKTAEALSGARMIDELSLANREKAIQYIKNLPPQKDRTPKKKA